MICVIHVTRNKHINLNCYTLGELHPTFNNSLQKQPLEVFCKNDLIKNFANFAGNDLYWSLFLIK